MKFKLILSESELDKDVESENDSSDDPKSNTTKKPYQLYTNGEKTIRVYDGDTPPEGYHRGQHHSHIPWNKGQTADSNERVKAYVDMGVNTRKENGSYENPWNKGLTKDDDPRIKGLSGEENPMFGKHPTAWNKGLTKETDDRMKKASENHKGVTAWNKGIPSGWHWTADAFKKRYETQMKNGTLSKNAETKAEIEYYEYLKTLFDESDIHKQYFDKERYPFRCDFYVESEDLFIEVHGNWTHGGRPFDPQDEECQKQLAEWEEKAKNSDYYKNAIYTWTDLDVRKVETAKKNNLNFEVIYYKY